MTIFNKEGHVFTEGEKGVVGDQVNLTKLTGLDVVACKESGVPMVNIDADQLQKGDLTFLKKIGLTISNPETNEPIALGVEVKKTLGRRLADWFDTPSEDNNDDDDSHFFSSSPSSESSSESSGSFFGGSSFGGFGGGSFGGGGASASF